MITEVHAITGFAHIKVKQTDINKWCYIRKHAFRQSCLMMFLVKRAIPLPNEGRAEALGFFLLPAPDGNAVSSVSLRPLDRTAVCCTQAESCTDTPPAGGTCASFLEVSICASDLSPLQRKLIRLDAPPFQGATPVINTKLKIATTKKEKCSDPFFFFQTTSFDVKITFYPV